MFDAIVAEWRHSPVAQALSAQSTQPILEGASPVRGDLKLGAPGVLEPDDQSAAAVGLDLGDPGEVDDRAPVDADELPRVEPLLELAQGAIHEVACRTRSPPPFLALGHEVRDLGGLTSCVRCWPRSTLMRSG